MKNIFWYLFAIACFCFSAFLVELGIFAKNASKENAYLIACVVGIVIFVAGAVIFLDLVEEIKKLSNRKKIMIFVPSVITIWLIAFFVCKFTFPSFWEGVDFSL